MYKVGNDQEMTRSERNSHPKNRGGKNKTNNQVALKRMHEINKIPCLLLYSCIDIYAHSCLKSFSIGRKLCSNSKTHVQIMKFTCRLNMGFGRRHWSVRRDVMCFVETKWPTLKKLRGFRSVFTFLCYFHEILSGLE